MGGEGSLLDTVEPVSTEVSTRLIVPRIGRLLGPHADADADDVAADAEPEAEPAHS